MKFLAIDFETANKYDTSACAIGLAFVENGNIIYRDSFLIKPPTMQFDFSWVHHIYPEDVKKKPTFDKLWPTIAPYFERADFFVAHNASFDRRVLYALCDYYRIPKPEQKFECTVILSRKVFKLEKASLDKVCKHFAIPLNHHEAGSDAEACAHIMIKVIETFE